MLHKAKLQPWQILLELWTILWIVDAQIAFTQLDNQLFKQVLRSAGVDNPSSRSTIVDTYLPLIYSYVLDKMLALLGRAFAFFNSFDGWSQRLRKFLSLTYHFVDPTTFR